MAGEKALEIEAKFILPDVETSRRLQRAERLGRFILSREEVQTVCDTYLDTPDRALLAAGYALRSRVSGGSVLITLKGLGVSVGAVHRREELETQLSQPLPLLEWPAGPVRERVMALVDGQPLIDLFALRQIRILRDVRDGDRTVAELSIDHARVIAGEREESYHEVEAELTPSGTEQDLAALVSCLRDEWGLKPEPRSKFERALAFVEGHRTAEAALLTVSERRIVQQISQREDLHARRARALLALDRGETQVVAGQLAGMSERRVRYWRARFREERLDVFPGRVLASIEAPSPLEQRVEPERPAPEQGCEPLPIESLFERYSVDGEHAEAVANLALALFDALKTRYHLRTEDRELLRTAALVHNVGLETDPDRHHSVGYDILLTHPPAGLDQEGRLIVAASTFLHRKRATANRIARMTEGPLARLSTQRRQEALTLAALVRMADGLDYAQSGTTCLASVESSNDAVLITVSGPFADVDGARADEKADLWRILYATDIHFVPAGEAAPEAEEPDASAAVESGPVLPKSPGLAADDTMAEAARKTLYFHFLRMLAHEQGTRVGRDIEELHDMRVATRRMRAALQVFGANIDMAKLKPFLKDLRRTGRVLGAVRDLDVFWEKTQAYLDGLPADEQDSLAPLRAVWEAQRASARETMIAYLDGERYARFTRDFEEFLQTPGVAELPPFSEDGQPVPRLLRHQVPVIVYERLAAVRAYDEWVTDPKVPLDRLHRLRIASKGLRYTFEFFSEVLAAEAEDLIARIKQLQDHLGNLQDAVVACGLLRDFLTWGTWGPAQASGKGLVLPEQPIVAPGVAAYLAARQRELQQLLDGFQAAWAPVHSAEFSQEVSAALAPL